MRGESTRNTTHSASAKRKESSSAYEATATDMLSTQSCVRREEGGRWRSCEGRRADGESEESSWRVFDWESTLTKVHECQNVTRPKRRSRARSSAREGRQAVHPRQEKTVSQCREWCKVNTRVWGGGCAAIKRTSTSPSREP